MELLKERELLFLSNAKGFIYNELPNERVIIFIK